MTHAAAPQLITHTAPTVVDAGHVTYLAAPPVTEGGQVMYASPMVMNAVQVTDPPTPDIEENQATYVTAPAPTDMEEGQVADAGQVGDVTVPGGADVGQMQNLAAPMVMEASQVTFAAAPVAMA